MTPFFSDPFCTARFVATCKLIRLKPKAATQEKYQLTDKTALSTKMFGCVIRNWPNSNVCIIGADVLGEDTVFIISINFLTQD